MLIFFFFSLADIFPRIVRQMRKGIIVEHEPGKFISYTRDEESENNATAKQTATPKPSARAKPKVRVNTAPKSKSPATMRSNLNRMMSSMPKCTVKLRRLSNRTMENAKLNNNVKFNNEEQPASRAVDSGPIAKLGVTWRNGEITIEMPHVQGQSKISYLLSFDMINKIIPMTNHDEQNALRPVDLVSIKKPKDIENSNTHGVENQSKISYALSFDAIKTLAALFSNKEQRSLQTFDFGIIAKSKITLQNGYIKIDMPHVQGEPKISYMFSFDAIMNFLKNFIPINSNGLENAIEYETSNNEPSFDLTFDFSNMLEAHWDESNDDEKTESTDDSDWDRPISPTVLDLALLELYHSKD